MSDDNHDPRRMLEMCRCCRRDLHPGRGDFYIVSILAVADPAPPVFSEDDLTHDIELEIQQLLAQLKTIPTQDAQEQVFRRVVFSLCKACYREWIADPTGG
jgi:hypothetical protein